MSTLADYYAASVIIVEKMFELAQKCPLQATKKEKWPLCTLGKDIETRNKDQVSYNCSFEMSKKK